MTVNINLQDWFAELKQADGTTRQKYADKFVKFCTTFRYKDEIIHDNFVTNVFITAPTLWNQEAYKIAKFLLSQPPKFVDLVCKTIKIENPNLFGDFRPVRIMEYQKNMFRLDTFEFILENYPTLFQETDIISQIISDKGLPVLKIYLEKNKKIEKTLTNILKIIHDDNYNLLREAFSLGKLFTDMLNQIMEGYRGMYYAKISLKSINMLKCFVELYPNFIKQISIVETYKKCEHSKEVLQILIEANLLTKDTKEPSNFVEEYIPDEDGYCDIPYHPPTNVIKLIQGKKHIIYSDSSEESKSNYEDTIFYLSGF